jgi:hypothetical protein
MFQLVCVHLQAVQFVQESDLCTDWDLSLQTRIYFSRKLNHCLVKTVQLADYCILVETLSYLMCICTCHPIRKIVYMVIPMNFSHWIPNTVGCTTLKCIGMFMLSVWNFRCLAPAIHELSSSDDKGCRKFLHSHHAIILCSKKFTFTELTYFSTVYCHVNIKIVT